MVFRYAIARIFGLFMGAEQVVPLHSLSRLSPSVPVVSSPLSHLLCHLLYIFFGHSVPSSSICKRRKDVVHSMVNTVLQRFELFSTHGGITIVCYNRVLQLYAPASSPAQHTVKHERSMSMIQWLIVHFTAFCCDNLRQQLDTNSCTRSENT